MAQVQRRDRLSARKTSVRFPPAKPMELKENRDFRQITRPPNLHSFSLLTTFTRPKVATKMGTSYLAYIRC